MRDIKFRVWDNVDYMSKPFTLLDVQRRLTQFTHDCTVMEYTGLTDKNGTEIYEGDICKYKVSVWPNGLDYEEVKVVEDLQCSMFDGNYGGGQDFYESISEIEIIGNIYENPELIGATA